VHCPSASSSYWNSFVILPYGSIFGITYLVYFRVFVCTVTDFSAAEKASGVKLPMLVRLLSDMSFSHFDDLWPRGRRMVGFASF